MIDETQRQLEEASRAIEARAREIEANGGPAPYDVRSATWDHWGDIPDSVQVSYERHPCADECLGIHNSLEGPVDCDGRPI